MASALSEARNDGGVVTRAAADGLTTIDEADAVQRDVAVRSMQPRVGWKVGATSDIAQRLFDIDGPALAPMFADHVFDSPAEVAIFTGQDISVECEFAFRFAHGLPPREAPYVREEVLDAVAAVMPAIEVVGCRFEGGFKDLGPLRLVAGMMAHAERVKGLEHEDWRGLDLKVHPARLYRGEDQK